MADAAPPEEPQAEVVEEEPEIPPCKADIFISKNFSYKLFCRRTLFA